MFYSISEEQKNGGSFFIPLCMYRTINVLPNLTFPVSQCFVFLLLYSTNYCVLFIFRSLFGDINKYCIFRVIYCVKKIIIERLRDEDIVHMASNPRKYLSGAQKRKIKVEQHSETKKIKSITSFFSAQQAGDTTLKTNRYCHILKWQLF